MKLGLVVAWATSILACLATGACTSLQQQARPINKLEARSLPPGVVTQRTLDLLADILVLPEIKRDAPPVNVLTYLPFEMPARLADRPGLCRKDTLYVTFGHDAQAEVDSSTRVRANGVEAEQHFALLPPELTADRANDEACRAIPDDKYFRTGSEYDAVDGAAALFNAIQQINNPPYDFLLDCGDGTATCVDFIRSFKFEQLWAISDCRQIGDPGQCWSYAYDYGGSLEVQTKRDQGRHAIVSVKKIDRYVSVHELID